MADQAALSALQERSLHASGWWYSDVGLAPLHMEMKPEEVITGGERQWALESENAQLRFIQCATFQSFFKDTYGLWDPEVNVSEEIARAEPNGLDSVTFAPQRPALAYEPAAFDDETANPSQEVLGVESGRPENTTPQEARAQVPRFLR